MRMKVHKCMQNYLLHDESLRMRGKTGINAMVTLYNEYISYQFNIGMKLGRDREKETERERRILSLQA